jgi:triacylglycerol lipase
VVFGPPARRSATTTRFPCRYRREHFPSPPPSFSPDPYLISIAPSNHGTAGLVTPPPDFLPSPTSGPSPACPACEDQPAGSPFLRKPNSIGDVQGPSYTVIATRLDEVVTPYQSQFLKGSAKQDTNITIQDKCPADVIEHDQAPKDPVVQQWVANALAVPNGPADPAFQPSCL